MPRITTGSAKNKQLKVPEILNIRVVQDVVKLAIFAIIGEGIVDSLCLDLYAGSGSLGLEALSRGAAFCDFVDENRTAFKTIKQNIHTLGFEGVSEVHQDNAIKYVANTEKKYDFVFCDPFFDDIKHKFLIQNIEESLAANGKVVFSHGDALDIQEQIINTKFEVLTQRRFGKAYITFLQVKS